VHLYDETQPLAVAQNRAHHFEVSFDKVVKAHQELDAKKYDMETEYERQLDALEVRAEANGAVIRWLKDMLGEIKRQAVRDQQDAVMMEPGDVARLTKVDLQTLLDSELRKAQARRERARAKEEAQEAAEGENSPQEAIQARLCTKCGKDDEAHIMWAQRHLPAYAESTADTPEAERSPEDICVCGHPRRQHRPADIDKYCIGCDNGTTHPFMLAVL
jgi:hypothetical protein